MAKIPRPTTLWAVPMLIHAFAGLVTLAYNFMSRAIFHSTSPNDFQIKVAAFGYFLSASALSSYLNRRLVLGAVGAERVTMIPFWRALTNTATWLGAIPVIAAIAWHLNGRINWFNFSNFCASIAIGWLIATSYSTLYYVVGISRMADLTWGPSLKKLDHLVKSLPYFATGVPFIAATSLLVLIHPDVIVTRAGSLFNGFLVMLYTLGAYGTLLVGRRAKKVRQILAGILVQHDQ